MRWISMVLGAVLLVAVAAQPASAVVVNMLIIDTQGNPVQAITFASNWGNKVTTLTTDATGRLKGDVPEGAHSCSVWSESTHVESGTCDFTTNRSSGTTTSQSSSSGTTETSPPQTDEEKAASKAIDIADELDSAVWSSVTGDKRTPYTRIIIIISSSSVLGGKTLEGQRGAAAFGVLLADLFGLTGGGGDGGDGDGGNGN